MWRLAWPLILSNLTVPLLGLVDTAVVGHLPDPVALGAVGLGAATFAALYLAFGALRMGTTALTAQAVGAEDAAEAKACLLRPLGIALGLGVLLLWATPGIVALAQVGFGASPAVHEALATYIGWRLWGAPAALANVVVLGWLLGHHHSRSQLVVLVTTNGLNALLDVYLVFGLEWGVAGVAMATALANWVGLAVGLGYCQRIWRRLDAPLTWERFGQPARFVQLFQVNGDLLLRSLALEGAFLLFAGLSARQGEIILAANAVLENFLLLQAYALDGFAFAAEALVGSAVGRRDAKALEAATAAAGKWLVGFALVIAVGYGLLGSGLIALLTSQGAVQATAVAFLPYLVLSPPIAAGAYLFDGVFAGATQTKELRNGTLLASGVFCPAALGLVTLHGNHGLWLALLLLLALRSGWFGWRYWVLATRGQFIPASGSVCHC